MVRARRGRQEPISIACTGCLACDPRHPPGRPRACQLAGYEQPAQPGSDCQAVVAHGCCGALYHIGRFTALMQPKHDLPQSKFFCLDQPSGARPSGPSRANFYCMHGVSCVIQDIHPPVICIGLWLFCPKGEEGLSQSKPLSTAVVQSSAKKFLLACSCP